MPSRDVRYNIVIRFRPAHRSQINEDDVKEAVEGKTIIRRDARGRAVSDLKLVEDKTRLASVVEGVGGLIR